LGERNIKFGAESPIPGPYNRELFPFFDRILEVLSPEHPARIVVLMKSAQIGGTVLAQIFTGASLDLDPSLFLYTHPTTDNATRWVKTKWRAMLRQTAALVRLFPSTTSRDGGNSMLYQERIDGRGALLVSGANSEASLSMISPARQVQDDLSKWEMNNAGDPESQADTRSKAFDWAKIFKISTPLIKAGCRISKAYKESTQERFHVPCPQCGHRHALEWENFVTSIDPENPGAAHFTCPASGCVIEQHALREHAGARAVGCGQPDVEDRRVLPLGGLFAAGALGEHRRALAGGQRAIRRKSRRSSTTISASPMRRPENLRLGKRSRHRPTRAAIRAASFRMAGCCYRWARLPGRSDRVALRAYGSDVRSWTVDYGVIEHHIATDEAHAELDKLLTRTWKDVFGNSRRRRPSRSTATPGPRMSMPGRSGIRRAG
jgi:phage terminase large subunit GpA-like protein